MKTFISSYAQNHFGVLIDAARIAPVAVTKYDKPFVVVMAVEEYERLKALEHPAKSPDARIEKKERRK